MEEIRIFLGTIERVKNFVNEVSHLECDVDIVSGRYVIDAIYHGNFQYRSVQTGQCKNSCTGSRSRKSSADNS